MPDRIYVSKILIYEWKILNNGKNWFLLKFQKTKKKTILLIYRYKQDRFLIFNRYAANTFVSTIERRKRSIFGRASWKKVENLANYGSRVLTGRRKPSATSTYLDIRVHIHKKSTSSRLIANEIGRDWEEPINSRSPFLERSYADLLWSEPNQKAQIIVHYVQ